MMLRRVLLPLLLLCCAGTLPALDPNRTLTQYVHRIWTVQQGLPSGTIYTISQTRDGFLWLGTQTGLVRFDGVRFTPAESLFRGLPENLWIRAAVEDAQGVLWSGTNEAGILRLQNGVVTRYSVKEGMPSDLVFCLLPGAGGDLWACTGNGLVHLEGGKTTVYHTRPASASDPATNADIVVAACRAPDGRLWVGGDRPLLLSKNASGDGFDSTVLRSIPADAAVRAISCAGETPLGQTVWVGTTAGLIRIQGSSQRLFTVKDGLADDGILSVAESRDGTLWIGTRSGYSRLRNGEFESFRPQDGLSQSSVFSLYEDREGSLWVGTKHGLNQFVEGRAIPYTVNEGLPSNDAGPLLQDQSGSMWVGMLDTGLARFNGRGFDVIRTRQGLASDTVLSLAENGAGGVWVGTDRGLNLLRDGRVAALYNRKSGLPSDEIRCLYRDTNGTLWVGTAAGLVMFDNGRFVAPKGAPPNPVLAMAGDRDGRPMFSTEHGLFRVVGGQVREIAPNGAALRGVDAIYRDPEGLTWLGSNGGSGLRLLEENGSQAKMTVFLVREGLFDNEIYGIVPDDLGRLWMACSKGIFSVVRADLLRFAAGEVKKISSTQYSPTDALRVIECKPGVQPGVWKMNDGRLWFSTIRGLIVLDPRRLQRNVPPPPVVIENPVVNGKPERADRIGSLPPGQKNIEFNYTGLSFLAPTRLTFRYILEGYDRDWIDAGTRRDAYYTNLPPGTFRFRVTACNVADGLCNDAGQVVQFTLAPHFYQRTWFFPILVALIALGIWVAYQLHIRRLRLRYELIVAERSRIARELHDTLIQGFSGVTMAMQALAGRVRSSEERSTLEDIIHDAANCLRETRRSVAGLRGAREAESGLAVSLAQAARQLTETKDIRLKLKLDKAPKGLPAEVEYNLLRIATEAISNAVKHSGARAIEVTLQSTPEALRLAVSDDGAGFAPDDHGHLKPGHYGLIGMKERAAQIGADFEFESAPGRGTTVVVVASVGRSAVVETAK